MTNVTDIEPGKLVRRQAHHMGTMMHYRTAVLCTYGKQHGVIKIKPAMASADLYNPKQQKTLKTKSLPHIAFSNNLIVQDHHTEL